MKSRKKFYEMIYQKTTEEKNLAWHNDVVPNFIITHTHKTNTGHALDIGCGTGNNSIFLAKQGYEVTSLDFIKAPLDLASEKANKSHIKLDIVHGDIFSWQSNKKYDLILDSGCLHNFRGKERKVYKNIIDSLLKDDGIFILVHFWRKIPFSFPFGPIGSTKSEIINLFSPHLKLLDFEISLDGELFYSKFKKFAPINFN